MCAVFDIFKGKVICRLIFTQKMRCFLLCVCEQWWRRKSSPSTRKARQRCCAHSPGEDRRARKGMFLCIYHQDRADCPTYSFSHRSCPKQHIWAELFDLVDFPRTLRVQFSSQSVDFARGRNFNISSSFRWLSAIFVNTKCPFRLSQSFLWKTSPSAALLWNATRPNPVPLTVKCQHTFKPGTHTDSLSNTDITFHFSMGSISKPSKPRVYF